jgi:hypothetical protein
MEGWHVLLENQAVAKIPIMHLSQCSERLQAEYAPQTAGFVGKRINLALSVVSVEILDRSLPSLADFEAAHRGD